MTNNTQHLTYRDVDPHMDDYVVKAFPVQGKRWNYTWHYKDGADTVKITLTIAGVTAVHHVPVLSVIGSA